MTFRPPPFIHRNKGSVVTEAQFVVRKALINHRIPFVMEFPIKTDNGKFTVDFLLDYKLVLEVDGSNHIGKQAQHKDAWRDKELVLAGYPVMHIRNIDVYKHLPETMWEIKKALNVARTVARNAMSAWEAQKIINKENQLDIIENRVYLDGRHIGSITKLGNGKKTLICHRNRKKHFFRKYNGWGISQEALHLLAGTDVTHIQVRIGKSTTLTSNLKDWFKHGKKYHKPPYEPQIILPEKHFTQEKLTLAQLSEVQP